MPVEDEYQRSPGATSQFEEGEAQQMDDT